MNCPKCQLEMVIAYQEGNQVLYKCKGCGHMTLVQEFERNGKGQEGYPRIKQ